MSQDARIYAIEYERSAFKDLRNLQKQTARRVRQAVDALSTNPRPYGSKKLAGAGDLYRLRVGDYCVIYAIVDERIVVLILRVAHRREAYRSQ